MAEATMDPETGNQEAGSTDPVFAVPPAEVPPGKTSPATGPRPKRQMDEEKAKEEILKHEGGMVLKPYKEKTKKGWYSVAAGFHLKNEFTEEEVEFLLDYDLRLAICQWEASDPGCTRDIDPDRLRTLKRLRGGRPYKLKAEMRDGQIFIDDHNMSKNGVPPRLGRMLLERFFESAKKWARDFYGEIDTLDDVRQRVLVNMAYNMGPGGRNERGEIVGGLTGFIKFRDALKAGDYDEAVKEMLDSKWAVQVGPRALELAWMMATDQPWKEEKRAPTAKDFPDALRDAVRKVELAIAEKKAALEAKKKAELAELEKNKRTEGNPHDGFSFNLLGVP